MCYNFSFILVPHNLICRFSLLIQPAQSLPLLSKLHCLLDLVMKSLVLYFLTFFVSVIALPSQPTKRDLGTFQTSIRDITNRLNQLTAAIRSLDDFLRGDVARAETEIEKKGHDVTDALRKGASNLRRSSALDTISALALLEPMETLEVATSAAINAFISKKSAITRAGGKDVVLRIMTEHDRAMDEYSEAFRSKMPAAAVPSGWIYTSRSKSTLQQGINAYRF
jgi:hypothetical protein